MFWSHCSHSNTLASIRNLPSLQQRHHFSQRDGPIDFGINASFEKNCIQLILWQFLLFRNTNILQYCVDAFDVDLIVFTGEIYTWNCRRYKFLFESGQCLLLIAVNCDKRRVQRKETIRRKKRLEIQVCEEAWLSAMKIRWSPLTFLSDTDPMRSVTFQSPTTKYSFLH